MLNFRELREQLTDEQIKEILLQFDVEKTYEDENKIIFPTCCHNLSGGSPKLYYYKNTKLFRCFTECQDVFDIFSLLQKMYRLRGKEISLYQIVTQVCSLDPNNCSESVKVDPRNLAAIRDMQLINDMAVENVEELTFKTYDKSILRTFPFDYVGLIPWLEEGIGVETLQKFNIKYDQKKDAIIIPNFNINGELIGIRERFFRPEDIKRGKYRPMFFNKVLYNHPTGRTFYGIYENQEAIKRKRLAIIFEGEKSVLKYGTIYGNDNNVSLATLGQNITHDHIQYLRKLNVRTVILAYDSDYEDYDELQKVEKIYREKAAILCPYFNVYYLMDYGFILPYKSSPIDGGKEAFEAILADRTGVKL